ncbi:MAG: sigma-70 family RNA polymerase sigma factor [Actinomycetota bacterium]
MDTYTRETTIGAEMRPDPALERRFRRVFDAHHEQVYAYCRRRCDVETARECTSEVFLTAWRRFEDIPPDDRALSWLYGVARKVLANEFRRQKRYRNLVGRVKSLGRPRFADVETVVVRNADHQAVIDAVARLRPQDQELLRLAMWEELSHGDIGEILGCTAHAVDQRIGRASKRLASELKRTGHIPEQKTTSDPLPRGEVT